ncbi:hypothetical protein WR25_14992 [Diploscapter pachys]|uniref:Uncharacterized protein n=1 Tax=Diploscapter pachys TaxID=2018661 RepID=A0A2A2M217_9BILA|nr:hypothetical protein WR25_14992 [Diploscapter pachys]
MMRALVENPVARLHSHRPMRLIAEVVGDHGLWHLCSFSRDRQRPGTVVAISDGERQAVLARLTIGMDAAHVALLIGSEVGVRRQQWPTNHLRNARGQPP